MTTPRPSIRLRERDAIINSLRAGVVPRIGQQLYQVGRLEEVKALKRDIETVVDGGSAIRVVVGEYGSGKTFFLQLVQSIAHERKLVTAGADLSPDRRLWAAGGQARNLYRELMARVATRSKPEGGALESIVERFATSAMEEAQEKGVSTSKIIQERMKSLSEMIGGYDFAAVIHAWWEGWDGGQEQRKSDAIRWLRGEFTRISQASACLPVRTIIDDENFLDGLKLFSRFVTMANYSGLYVLLDEMVNIFKLSNTISRERNYERMLVIINACMQGDISNMGVVFGGTPEFLMDRRRGVYSYGALETRLRENSLSGKDLQDYTGPVLRLSNLSPEDVYILLQKLRHVWASGDESQYLLTDMGIQGYLNYANQKLGAATFRTPRGLIKGFLDLLALLEQDRSKTWQQLLGQVEVSEDKEAATPVEIAEDSPLGGFKL